MLLLLLKEAAGRGATHATSIIPIPALVVLLVLLVLLLVLLLVMLLLVFLLLVLLYY